MSFPPISREGRYADRMLQAYRDTVTAAVTLREAARSAPMGAGAESPRRPLVRTFDRLRRQNGSAGGWTRRGQTDFERVVEAWHVVYQVSVDMHEGSRRAWLAAGRSEESWRIALSDVEDLGGLV